MTTTRVEPSCCPGCLRPLSAATGLESGTRPKPRDVSVCLYCGELLEFDNELKVQRMSDKTKEDLAPKPEMFTRLHVSERVLLDGKIMVVQECPRSSGEMVKYLTTLETSHVVADEAYEGYYPYQHMRKKDGSKLGDALIPPNEVVELLRSGEYYIG